MKFELSDRDRQVVIMVSRLGQVSTMHLKTLLFADVNRISMDRCIKRLRDDKLIKRLGARARGQSKGTPPSVYVLGPKGWWYLRRQGEYPSITAIREHSLHIADIFTKLVELDRAGTIKLLPATDIEHVVGNMRVDLYVDFGLPALSKRRPYYVEVQEHARADLIKQKLTAHWEAYENAQGGFYPEVAFVARDDYLKWRIGRLMQPHHRELVTVYTLDEFLTAITAQKAGKQ